MADGFVCFVRLLRIGGGVGVDGDSSSLSPYWKNENNVLNWTYQKLKGKKTPLSLKCKRLLRIILQYTKYDTVLNPGALRDLHK